MPNLVTLPTAEQSASIALACAGLNGHPAIADAVTRAGGALNLLELVHDDPSVVALHPDLIDRIRSCGTPATVARVLEMTRREGLRLVSPTDDDWPSGLRDLGRGAPRVLWVAGARTDGSDRPIGITGGLHPAPATRRRLLEVAVSVLDRGYQVTCALRGGVDETVLNAAVAANGRGLVVAHNPRAMVSWRDHPRITVVSENPPASPLGLRSMRRAHSMLAVLAQRVLIVDADRKSPAAHAGVAAAALGRPLAVLAGTVAAGDDRLRREFGAQGIHSGQDLLRLS